MPLELKWILLCLALVAGEALGFAAEPFSCAWPVAAGAALVVGLAGYGFAVRHWPFVFVLAVGTSLALCATERRKALLDEMRTLNCGRPVRAVFAVGEDVSVEEDGRGGGRASFAGSLRGIPVRVMMAYGADGERPRAGETWELSGWLGRGDEGLFGGRSRTFWVRGRGASARRVAASPTDPLVLVRRDFSRRVGIGLDASDEAADLNRAMLLGERFRIPSQTRKAFVEAGTVHVFAISGLHVLFIAKIFAVFLACTFLPFRLRGLVLVPLLWMYVALVGSGPSAVRAAMMATVGSLAPVFWRRSNGFVSWSVAFMLTYLHSPEMVFDVGCTLSFTVMFAIVAWSWWSKSVDLGWAKPLGTTAVIWLAGVPIAAHVFGRITPGGLLANLFAIPAAQAGVTAGALGLIASYVSETLAAHLNNFSALATRTLAELSRLVASQGWASQSVRPWTLVECAAWYAAAVAALLAVRSVHLRRKLSV